MPRRLTLDSIAIVATVAVSAAVFLLFMGLVPVGRWQGDEFFVAANIREQGVGYLVARVWNWSPRPLSEFLLYGYFRAVDFVGSPFIGIALGTLWLSSVATVLSVSATANKGQRLAVLAVLSSLLAVTFCGTRNSDAFYWVQGAAAYIPTIASMFAVQGLMLASQGDGKDRTNVMLWGVLVAGLSSEIGLFLAFSFSGLVLAGSVIDAYLGRANRRAVAMSAMVFSSSIGLMLLLALGRGASSVESANPVVGDVLASIIRAVWHLIKVSSSFGVPHLAPSGSVSAYLIGFALVIGNALLLHRAGFGRRPTRTLAFWTLALFFGAFATMFSSFYKLGIAGYERHMTMVYAFVLLGFSTAALAALHKLPSFGAPVARHASSIAGILLCLAMGSRVITAGPALAADYRNFPKLASNQNEIWMSGYASESPITVRKPIKGQVVGGFDFYPAVGTYVPGPQDPWDRKALYRFFGKSRLEILEPLR